MLFNVIFPPTVRWRLEWGVCKWIDDRFQVSRLCYTREAHLNFIVDLSKEVSCVAVEMKFPYISRFHDFPDQNVNIFTRSYSKFPPDILVKFLDFFRACSLLKQLQSQQKSFY